MFDETRYILRMDAPLSRWNGCWQLSHKKKNHFSVPITMKKNMLKCKYNKIK
jgi:hypothetical protein